MPAAAGEVAVNGELADRGPFALGDDLEVRGGPTLTGRRHRRERHATAATPIAVGPPGAFDLRDPGGQHTWLVDAGGAVTWDDVQALNAIGAPVLSRAVLLDPPPDSALDPELGWATGTDDAWLAVSSWSW